MYYSCTCMHPLYLVSSWSVGPWWRGMPGGHDGGVGLQGADQDDKIRQTVCVGPGAVEPCAGCMALWWLPWHDGTMLEPCHGAMIAALHNDAMATIGSKTSQLELQHAGVTKEPCYSDMMPCSLRESWGAMQPWAQQLRLLSSKLLLTLDLKH